MTIRPTEIRRAAKLRAWLILLVLPALALLAARARAEPAGSFYLKDGDRVVFYGDSITEQSFWGAGAYADFTETYVLTRFPGLNVDFTNSGWGGDAVSWSGGGPVDVRVQRDIVAHNPTVVTIMLGMNDGKYRAFDQGIFDTYRDGYRKIVDTLRKDVSGLRITLIEPSPFDDVTRAPNFEGGYNAVLLRYAQFVKGLADEDWLTAADFNTPVVAMLEKAKAADPALAQKIINDRIHPGPGAHLLMAEALLKSWNAPSLVTDVEIDAAKGVAVRSEGARIGALEPEPASSRRMFAWNETDDSLPMPVDLSDPATALAIHCSDFVDSLDREDLRVTGLGADHYALKIDGMSVGIFTKEQLAAGVGLALLPTPMAKQAAEVHKLTERRNHIHFIRWHWIEVSLSQDGTTEAIAAAVPPLLKALDDEEADVTAQQRAKAQPVAHLFQLEPL
jgi:lysophospholipase L1-like esterase